MKRRDFLLTGTAALLPVVATKTTAKDGHMDSTTLFLAGDVMSGRGIDQILPHPGNPRIYESYLKSALDYVALSEQRFGKLRLPVDFSYPWGDALADLDHYAPDFRVINLETAITARGEPWPGKGIQYRMHPSNLAFLDAARPDCCVLANNHVLDWGYEGLADTLETLSKAGIPIAGAGRDDTDAARPALLKRIDKRMLVLACGFDSSGIPAEWAAGPSRAGVNFLADLSNASLQRISMAVSAYKQKGDIVIASLHWGSNWGYAVSSDQRRFAHALIDEAGVDIVHGHSSHHPRPIEVYKGKPVLYGCGDLINDYEGITGHEAYRGDLGLMYFLSMDNASGQLSKLEMRAFLRRSFRLNTATPEDASWLAKKLDEECARFGCGISLAADQTLHLSW